MSERYDVTDPTKPVPTEVTPTMVGDDLGFANEYGGWVNYEPQGDGTILAKLYDEAGEIASTFLVELSITEVS